MATEELRPAVSATELFGSNLIAPLPEDTTMDAAFVLVKLSDGEWCARSVGSSYNRVEFLGQLTAYTHALLRDEATGWFEEEDGDD